jgi:glycosyltransferase involved in cell wall biosynthesis
VTDARRVSVIVAAYHSAATVESCLDGLDAQTMADLEVILVNSSAADGTGEIAARFPRVTYLESAERLLPHQARNRGVEVARGELLAFTDADCRPRPDWAERLLEATRSGHSVVCGAIEPAADLTWEERGVHMCKYHFRLAGLVAGPTDIAGTANSCVTREVWEAVGPFDGERFSGDGVLSWRAAAQGFRPWFEPRALVEHRDSEPLGVRGLWRERLARGRDFAEVRVAFRHWSRARAIAYLLALPALPVAMTLRAGVDALRVRRMGTWLVTLPVQVIGHLGWCLGEARSHLARACSLGRHSQPPAT